jgi:hypothetical protein
VAAVTSDTHGVDVVVVVESAAPVEGWIVGPGPPVRFGGWLELVARVSMLLASVEREADATE